jgi:hypothetical protein
MERTVRKLWLLLAVPLVALAVQSHGIVGPAGPPGAAGPAGAAGAAGTSTVCDGGPSSDCTGGTFVALANSASLSANAFQASVYFDGGMVLQPGTKLCTNPPTCTDYIIESAGQMQLWSSSTEVAALAGGVLYTLVQQNARGGVANDLSALILGDSHGISIGSGTAITRSQKATATIPTTSLVAGTTCSSLQVAMTAATEGAQCRMGLPSSSEALIADCWVSDAGVVKMQFCASAGSITPAGSQTAACRCEYN